MPLRRNYKKRKRKLWVSKHLNNSPALSLWLCVAEPSFICGYYIPFHPLHSAILFWSSIYFVFSLFLTSYAVILLNYTRNDSIDLNVYRMNLKANNYYYNDMHAINVILNSVMLSLVLNSVMLITTNIHVACMRFTAGIELKTYKSNF